MIAIKIGEFYYVSYDEEADETFYSSSHYSAKTFETLEEIDEFCLENHISSYGVEFIK